jgi:hypothetical protein
MSETMQSEHEDHDALNCPECQAASEACKVLGTIGEAMEKALADGAFERMGRQMAQERERRMLEAFINSTSLGQERERRMLEAFINSTSLGTDGQR